MTGVHRLWFVAVLLLVTSTALVTVAHAQQCYNKTILCENFTTDGNNCSSNIQRFVVHRIPGCEPQYQIQLMLRHAISGDTDVRVVRCSSPSECDIDNITADSFLGDSSCDCQVPLRMSRSRRGITCTLSNDFFQEGATLLRFTRTSDDCSEEPANIVMILTMEEAEHDENCAALPANINCSTSEHFSRCFAACSDYDPIDQSSSCHDVCGAFIQGFCDMNCTTTDGDSLRRCQCLCSDEFYDALNFTCTRNPCTNRSEDESEISVLGSLQCLPSCLRVGMPPFQNTNITSCSETICSSLLEDCESSLYDLECEENGDRRLCQLLCRRNGTVNSLVNQQCSGEQIEVFCGEEFEDGKCGDLPLFNEDCDERRTTCTLMCTGNMRTLDRRCRPQVRDFCFGFLQHLLQEGGTDFDSTNVMSAVRVLRKSTITSELRETLGGMRSLFRYFENFTNETRQFVASQRDTVGELMEVFDDLFDETRVDQWNNLTQDGIDSSESLQSAENLAGIVGRSMISSNNTPFMFLGQNLVMRADSPALTNVDGGVYVFSADNVSNLTGARMEVPLELLCEDGVIDGCSTVVSSMLVNNLATYLNNDIPETVSNRTVNSILLSTQVFGAPNLSSAILDYPIKFFFTPLESNGSVELNNSECVYWDFNTSQWRSDGITTEIVNSSVLCISTHLTSFAVLVQVTPGDEEQSASALSVVSYVGCAISILSLILTIILLLVFRKSLNKGALLYIHLNLAIALLIALVIFVAGIETAITIPWLCTTITALLQYFFLCVFCWMLAEGIMLYLLVVKVFGKAAQKWYYLLILGWGVPVPIVAISAGILRDDYGTTSYCWIKPDPTSAAIWTFVGPMIIMVLINTVILVMTIVSMVRGRMHGGAEQGVKTRELIKSTLKATIILLPLMGVTWIIGLFAVDRNTEVFAWLFTIFNSLQGLFILIFHVLRNEVVLGKVRKHVKKCITRIAGAKEDHKSFTNGTGTKDTHLGSTSGLHPLDNIAKDAKTSSYEFVIKNGLHALDSTDGKLKATYHLDKC